MRDFARRYGVIRTDSATAFEAPASASGRAGSLLVPAVLAGVICLSLSRPLPAQDEPKVSSQALEQIQQINKEASGLMDTWDQQYVVIDQATDNVFQQQGWTSEPDQAARSMMRDVGRIPPWKPRERQEAFMGALQQRYNLTTEQRSSMDSEIQREAMMVTVKHFKDLAPMALEFVRTRAKGDPFTAEQVQRWSKVFEPVMADSLEALNRVTENAKKTMTAEQRRQLELDVAALKKRHQDFEKMVARWQAGQWSPADWGLQNDAVHSGAMAEQQAAAAEKAALAAADANKAADAGASLTNESDWDRYVKLFCDKYGCTDVQRTTAQGILRNSKTEAIAIRNARRDQIARCEQLAQSAETPAGRKAAQDELQRLLSPIGDIFNRMKDRLYQQVLTTEQRLKGPPDQVKPAAPQQGQSPPAQSKPQPTASPSPPRPQPATTQKGG